MRLRPARPGEVAELSDLALRRAKGHWGYDADFLERCRAELRIGAGDVAAGRVTVAADADDQPLGVLVTILDTDEPTLDMLFVDPPAIGQGVGRALLQAAVEQARAAGIDTLLIASDPNAEPFYLAHGAQRIGERPSEGTGRTLPLPQLAHGRLSPPSYAAQHRPTARSRGGAKHRRPAARARPESGGVTSPRSESAGARHGPPADAAQRPCARSRNGAGLSRTRQTARARERARRKATRTPPLTTKGAAEAAPFENPLDWTKLAP